MTAVVDATQSAIIRHLRQKHGKGVRDVRKKRYYQKRDIDFLLPDETAVEVKTDTWLHKTGNLFFEVVRDHGYAGCFHRSKADMWVYVCAETGTAYLFRLSEAQAWLSLKGKPEWVTRTRDGKGVEYVGYKVPVADFLAGVRTEVFTVAA